METAGGESLSETSAKWEGQTGRAVLIESESRFVSAQSRSWNYSDIPFLRVCCPLVVKSSAHNHQSKWTLTRHENSFTTLKTEQCFTISLHISLIIPIFPSTTYHWNMKVTYWKHISATVSSNSCVKVQWRPPLVKHLNWGPKMKMWFNTWIRT